jgi:hypothetical protein
MAAAEKAAQEDAAAPLAAAAAVAEEEERVLQLLQTGDVASFEAAVHKLQALRGMTQATEAATEAATGVAVLSYH